MKGFSANLGFLWSDCQLPDAILRAAAAGFDAVECHCPYETPPADVLTALQQAGLPMISLNTRNGAPGESGLAALPGRSAEARDAIDQALAYAAATGTAKVHVMAGVAGGAEAQETFSANLRYACNKAADQGIMILIEPLNRYDAPGYFLQTSAQALEIIRETDLPNLRLMFDCYHVQIMEGDLTRRLRGALPLTGHIQIASVPDRGAPDKGELDYRHVLHTLREAGYGGYVGAEYRTEGPVEASLGWMQTH